MRTANDEPRSVTVPMPWQAAEPPLREHAGITYMLVGAYASLILFVIW